MSRASLLNCYYFYFQEQVLLDATSAADIPVKQAESPKLIFYTRENAETFSTIVSKMVELLDYLRTMHMQPASGDFNRGTCQNVPLIFL